MNSIEYNGIEQTEIELNGIEQTGIELNGIELNGIELNGIEQTGIEYRYIREKLKYWKGKEREEFGTEEREDDWMKTRRNN